MSGLGAEASRAGAAPADTAVDSTARGPIGGSVRRGDTVSHLIAGVVLPAITAAIAVAGLWVPVPGGPSALAVVAVGLVLAWALAAAARVLGQTPQWPLTVGALTAAAALTAARLASQPTASQHQVARVAATVAGPLVIAMSCHFMLALPSGRLGGRLRRAGAGVVYLAALGAGAALALANRAVPAAAAAAVWAAIIGGALIAVRLRYAGAVGRDRERLQWLGIGLVTAAVVALVTAVLHLLVGWPGAVAAIAAAATAAVPLSVVAGGIPALAPHGGRLLVHLLSVAGFTLVVVAVYLVVVLGLGKTPSSPEDREILGLSMLAAAVAAIGYLPSRDRFLASATRFVYGAREAPDEVLRTFGSRMTRAVAMDELLLQLAESLRKTMGLTSAEVYTGSAGVLERAVSVPDAGRRSILLTERERPVVTRAGVSGTAWATVWLPALLDGRGQSQLRVAPISHGGELLGLLVVERPAGADAFTEEDDRVLTELARQAGLALHNARLDTALQTTLDELRTQADQLRESRARIVAAGDAERRRVERDLHDGAQQHLVALAVNMRLASDIVTDDPSAGAEMLAQMVNDVQATIKDLRELAHGIYPPLLVDAGLAEALRAAAGRCAIPVDVSASAIGRYPQGVEAAVYFCCLEALQNAAKHAPQATAQMRLWEESGGLLFSVTDDGPGFDPAKVRAGHGFVNMSDRLGAFGGTVRWESRPGHGSSICGSVPII
jgi:signal transduction histidine kinase